MEQRIYARTCLTPDLYWSRKVSFRCHQERHVAMKVVSSGDIAQKVVEIKWRRTIHVTSFPMLCRGVPNRSPVVYQPGVKIRWVAFHNANFFQSIEFEQRYVHHLIGIYRRSHQNNQTLAVLSVIEKIVQQNGLVLSKFHHRTVKTKIIILFLLCGRVNQRPTQKGVESGVIWADQQRAGKEVVWCSPFHGSQASLQSHGHQQNPDDSLYQISDSTSCQTSTSLMYSSNKFTDIASAMSV